MRALTTSITRHAACSAILFALLFAILPPSSGAFATDVAAASNNEEKRERHPTTFTLNRVRLYVISARRGEPRVFLPPLRGYHPRDAVNEAVAGASIGSARNRDGDPTHVTPGRDHSRLFPGTVISNSG